MGSDNSLMHETDGRIETDGWIETDGRIDICSPISAGPLTQVR